MRDLPIGRMTSDVRSLAEQIGSQATEALIRVASGVEQASGEGLSAAASSAQRVGGQAGQTVSGQVQSLALPTVSARVAWRAGKIIGRVEGAVRLARFGVRIWWRQRQRRRRRRNESAFPAGRWLSVLAQWGPTTIASVWLVRQVWGRWQQR